MDRKFFLKSLAILPLAGTAMKLNELNKITGALKGTEKMPVLFLGHGSPMNAIEDNEFSNGWKNIGQTLPRPVAILCISAHWETNGTLLQQWKSLQRFMTSVAFRRSYSTYNILRWEVLSWHWRPGRLFKRHLLNWIKSGGWIMDAGAWSGVCIQTLMFRSFN